VGAGSNASTVTLRVVGGDEREVSNLSRWSVGADPVVLAPEIDCAGEDRQRLWTADPSFRRGWGGGERSISGPETAWQWWKSARGPQIGALFRSGLANWLDATSSWLRGNEYERKKWKYFWKRCFIIGPPRIYVSRDSRLPLQGVKADLNHLHRSPAIRKRRRKGNPVPGGITGPPYSWGI
jgi:hypothetical protein